MTGQGPPNDPICGKPVEPAGSRTAEYKHKTYYFCSDRCRERFEKRTERMRLQELARMGALLTRSKARWGIA